MQLSDLRPRSRPRAWFVFDAETGMRMQLEYATLEELRARAKLYTLPSEGDGGVRDGLEDAHLEDLAQRIISWEGFTLGTVSRILDINVPKGRESEPVPCDAANKKELLCRSHEFRSFVEQELRAAEIARRLRMREEKKPQSLRRMALRPRQSEVRGLRRAGSGPGHCSAVQGLRQARPAAREP